MIKGANLLLRFLLELCALGVLGYWGFKTGSVMSTKVVLGVGAALVAAVVSGAHFCLLGHRSSCPGGWSWFFRRWSRRKADREE